MTFVVTPRFVDLHPDVVAEVESPDAAGVSIRAITRREHERLERTPGLRYFEGWNLVCRYAGRFRADRALVMYFDFFLLPTLVGRLRGRIPPCPYAGIYYRPTFHYPRFSHYRHGWKERARAFRKRVLLGRVLRDPRLAILYCLDPFVIDYIATRFETTARVLPIADSFARYEPSSEHVAQIRSELGIEPHRRVFCLVGILDARKGITQLLECLPRVPLEPAERMCLILAGRVSDSLKERVRFLIATLRRTSPIQVVLHDRYVRDDRVQSYYELADVILATYQGHMGSSATLVRAALAQKPVLSAAYGLMGELVGQWRLGDTVDTTDAGAMASGIKRFLEADPATRFDPRQAARFAEEHSPERLAVALSHMVSQPTDRADSPPSEGLDPV